MHLTPGGAKALSCGIQSSAITELCLFRGNGYDLLGLDRSNVMKILYTQGVAGSRIRTLSSSRILGDVNAFAKLAPMLDVLKAEYQDELNLAGTRQLATALVQATSIHTLHLTYCELEDEHMHILSSCLGGHKSITNLCLADNKIGDDGIVAFVEHWSLDSLIRVLDLSGNRLSGRGVQLLVAAMAIRTTECDLELSYNQLLNCKEIKLIGQALGGKMLSKLHLGNSYYGYNWMLYGDESCEAAINEREQFLQAGRALLEGVRDNVYLKSLVTRGYSLPDDMVSEMELLVTANQNGRYLLQQQHTVPFSFWGLVLARQSSNPSLMFYFLRELPSLIVGRGGRKRRSL
jgi:hypothetical protein